MCCNIAQPNPKQETLQKQFFQMLPTDFTKQDAVKMAEVLGIGNKTIDRWLQKSINRHEIQHVTHGIYSKIKDEIA